MGDISITKLLWPRPGNISLQFCSTRACSCDSTFITFIQYSLLFKSLNTLHRAYSMLIQERVFLLQELGIKPWENNASLTESI